jgi:hypothetical protein
MGVIARLVTDAMRGRMPLTARILCAIQKGPLSRGCLKVNERSGEGSAAHLVAEGGQDHSGHE